MTLTLLMIRCPELVAPERREVRGGDFSIGRGPDNDWILPDPERHLSKRHCQFVFRAGAWSLLDLSANGTFLNSTGTPVGNGSSRPLRDGDRIIFGPYELEVSIDEMDFSASVPARPGSGAATGYSSLPADMLDPFAAAPPPPAPFGAPTDPLFRTDEIPSGNERSVSLPADFDPLAPEDDPFRGPTHSDHAPAFNDAFRPPPTHPAAIPDDWDLGFPSAAPTTPEPSRGFPQEPLRQPQAAPPPLPPNPPFAPVQPLAPVQPPEPVQRPSPLQPAAAVRDPDLDLLAAFLRGAGLADASVADPQKTMEAMGAAVRAAVSGIRQVLIARASIKSEFRIEQTMIQAMGNNPLKFSADDDDALAALLGIGRRVSMAPAAAVADALHDMQLHELAMISAMQTAVRALMAQFDPGTIDRQAEKGGLGLLPGQRKARAWEAFEAMHGKVTKMLSDDFDSVFGKALARAYEQATAELSAGRTVP